MKIKMRKPHNDEWFARQEARIAEPINNTLRYYRKPFVISIIIYLSVFALTFDYYGAGKGFVQLFKWFSVMPKAWRIVLEVLLFVLWNGARVLFLILTVKRMKNMCEYTAFAVIYHVFCIPIFGILGVALMPEWWKWLIWNVILYGLRVGLFLYLKGYVRSGFECEYYVQKFEEQKANYLDKGRSVTLIGAPGSGKTVSGGTMSIVLAGQRWEALKFDYFTENARKDYYIKTLNVEKLKRLQALKESYEFYVKQEHEYIPCLITTIGMQDLCGRYSYQLTAEVYAQLKRVPEYSVLFNDESGRQQGCQTSKNANENVLDFWRLNRHFGDFILINTEQGADGNGKYIRKCTDYNLRCYYQEWKLPPLRLQERFQRRKMEFEEAKVQGELTEAQERYILQELYYEAKYIATIGFRKIRQRKEGTPEQGALQISEDEQFMIIPSRTIYNYDDRAYAELYKCADEPIELVGWTSLTLNSDIVEDDKGDVITTND